MFELRLISIEREQTDKTKKKIEMNLCYPQTSIHYITKGKGYFNGKLLTAGEGFVCFQNQTVCYYPDADDPWEYVWMNVEGETVNAKNCRCDIRDNCFRFSYDAHFEHTVSYIMAEKYEYAYPMQNNKMFEVICADLMLAMHFAKEETAEYSCRKRHVELAKQYMHSNYHLHISMEKLAQRLFLSSGYLRNIFYMEEGVSPQQYLIAVRMERAKTLIETTGLPMHEIAAAVGYDDATQFYKLFKKKVGLSPTRYKNERLHGAYETEDEIS